MFDRICCKNGIRHRLTQPASPNQNGKVERFHGTLRPDFFNTNEPFLSLAAAQEALDVWVAAYNTDRPHQALDAKQPVVPADRFAPTAPDRRELLPLWLPTVITTSASDHDQQDGDHGSRQLTAPGAVLVPATAEWSGGPVKFDVVVPPSGNMSVAGRQKTNFYSRVEHVWARSVYAFRAGPLRNGGR